MGLWNKITGKGADGLPWDNAAEKALSTVPVFMRPLVRSKVEAGVREEGGSRVTEKDCAQARKRFQSVFGNMKKKELEGAMPAENAPGASMTVVQVCRGTLSDCPNPLMDAELLEKSILQWIGEKNLDERLRQRVKSGRILYHHKLKIFVSACPNGCARHQTADMGVTGWVRPEFDRETCNHCQACVRSCPDNALAMEDDHLVYDAGACMGCHKCLRACKLQCVTHGPAGFLLLAGGKLGRHPHLARPVGVFEDACGLLEAMGQLVEDYLEHSPPGQRFADWWIQRQEQQPASGKRIFFDLKTD